MGQTRIRKCIVWVYLDGMLEILDSFLGGGARSLVPIKTTFEIELIGLWVFRVMLSDTPLLCARKLQTELAGNLSCDFALYRKEISTLTALLLTPNLSLV